MESDYLLKLESDFKELLGYVEELKELEGVTDKG